MTYHPVMHPCGVSHSLSGQPWRWRGLAASDLDQDDLVTQLLLSRGVERHALELHRLPTIRAFMPDPSIFQDMDRAAARLADAVQANEAVTVFGDYDVDGATSAALLIRLLRELGCTPAHYIPDRIAEGYGPSAAALIKLANDGASLIVTVDCGAQAFDALEAARDHGVDILVVDHHQCGTALPFAHALVNPNRLDEDDEAASHGHLAAVGVAFLLAAATVRTLRSRHFFAARPEPKLTDLLDLVALGTVADVARLTGLNRAFVTQGLKVMANRRHIGLAALLDVSRLKSAPTCRDLGFALGPRINAGGRVGKSDLGVRLLVTQDEDEARAIAAELERLNEDRRAIEAAVSESADLLANAQDAPVAVVAGFGWHPGVIGIVAGRLKERLGRPAIVIAIDEHGVGKGSGRSIPGVDLGAAILAAKEHGLIIAGGGHAQAAGLTVATDAIPALAAFLSDRLGADIAAASANRALLLDAVLSCGGITPSLCEALDAGGPYGMGWPAPRIAAGPMRVVKADIVGQGHVRAIMAGDDGRSLKTVAFRAAALPLGQALLAAPPDRRLWVAGKVKINDWNDRRAAEMHLDDAAWA